VVVKGHEGPILGSVFTENRKCVYCLIWYKEDTKLSLDVLARSCSQL